VERLPSIKTMKALGFRYGCVVRGFNAEGSAGFDGATMHVEETVIAGSLRGTILEGRVRAADWGSPRPLPPSWVRRPRVPPTCSGERPADTETFCPHEFGVHAMGGSGPDARADDPARAIEDIEQIKMRERITDPPGLEHFFLEQNLQTGGGDFAAPTRDVAGWWPVSASPGGAAPLGRRYVPRRSTPSDC
jgi:hypothetical protein